MNRRGFLKAFGIGAGAAVLAAQIPLSLLSQPVAPAATLGTYYNYANFSSLAIASSIDEIVENSAVELGYRAGLSIQDLYAATLDG